MRFVITNPDLFPVEYLGYIDPDDFFSYNGIVTSKTRREHYKSISDLITHIQSRRASIGLPEISNLEAKIHHYLYALNIAPRSLFTRIDDSSTIQDPLALRSFYSDIITASNLALALSKAAISGRSHPGSYGWVTKTEATERAAICSQCPKNISIQKSKLTKFNNKLAALFTPMRKTDFDKQLNDCEVCGCPLQSKVHYSAEVITKVTPEQVKAKDFPEDFFGHDGQKYRCWLFPIIKKRET